MKRVDRLSDEEIDDIDRGILYPVQQDARNLSSEEVADRAGIASSTVRKRIRRLESEAVITMYSAAIDSQDSSYPPVNGVALYHLDHRTGPRPRSRRSMASSRSRDSGSASRASW